MTMTAGGLKNLADDLGTLVWRKRVKKPAERRGGHLTDELPALNRTTRETPRNAAGLFLHLREAGLLQGRRECPAFGEGKRHWPPGTPFWCIMVL
jgi:hypothetical protein